MLHCIECVGEIGVAKQTGTVDDKNILTLQETKKLLWKLNWRMFPRLSQYGCFRLQVSVQVLPSPSGSPSMLSQAYELLQHTATTGAHWDFENLATSVS